MRPPARILLVALVLSGVSCRHEASNPSSVRFDERKLGVGWDTMPSSVAERRKVAGEQAQTAQRLVVSGQAVEGIARLRRAVDLHPGNAELRLKLVAAFEHLGDFDAALRVVRETLRIRPGHPLASYTLGRLLFVQIRTTDRDELQEARAAWQSLLAAGPGAPGVRHVRALLPLLDRRLARARESARRADAGVPGKKPAVAAAAGEAKTPPAPIPAAPPVAEAARLQSTRGTENAADALMEGNELMERRLFRRAAAAYRRAVKLGGGEAARRLAEEASRRARGTARPSAGSRPPSR